MTQTLAMMSAAHIILVAVVVLLLFGAQKIPQLMRSLGSGMNEFKKGLKEGESFDVAQDKEALLSAAPPLPPGERTPKSE